MIRYEDMNNCSQIMLLLDKSFNSPSVEFHIIIITMENSNFKFTKETLI